MQGIISNMTSCFADTKLAGSYFALYIISLFLLSRMESEKNRWYVLYALSGLLLVFANPLTIFLLGKAFPILQSYRPFLMFIPVPFYIAFAGMQLFPTMKEEKSKWICLLLAALLIGVAGDFYGLYQPAGIPKERVTKEQKQIVEMLSNRNGELVLADESILPYLRTQGEKITLLYGRDLWTPGMDMGIVDGYTEELTALYEAMKNPGETMKDISEMAALYECDLFVVKNYENNPACTGNYKLLLETENYLIYEKN